MCGSVNTVNTSSVNEGSLPQVNLVSLRCLFVCLSVCACVYVCVCVCVRAPPRNVSRVHSLVRLCFKLL